MGWFRIQDGKIVDPDRLWASPRGGLGSYGRGVGFGPPPQSVIGWDPANHEQLVETLTIPGGDAGTEATIQIMTRLAGDAAADPAFVLRAQGIVAGVGSKQYRESLERIFRYVRSNMSYVRDPIGLEWLQTPYYSLEVRRAGDCDDMSIVLVALSLAIGLGGAFRAIKADPGRPDEYSHVYAVLGMPDGRGGVSWLPADATQAGVALGWEPPADRVFKSKTWVVATP